MITKFDYPIFCSAGWPQDGIKSCNRSNPPGADAPIAVAAERP